MLTSCSVAAPKIQTRCNVIPSSFHCSLFVGNCYLNAIFCNATDIVFLDMTVRLASYWEFFGLLGFAIVTPTFSYTKIFFTIRHQKTQVHRGENPLNIARYKKTVYNVVWMQFAMLTCYSPYIIMTLIWWFRVIDDPTELLILEITDTFFICLLFLNSSLNPILYCWRIRDVKKEVKNAIGECTCCWVCLQRWKKIAANYLYLSWLQQTVTLYIWFRSIRHVRDKKGTGPEMRPVIVSGTVTGDAPVSNWLNFPLPSNSPRR